jgi:hypothetical protein
MKATIEFDLDDAEAKTSLRHALDGHKLASLISSLREHAFYKIDECELHPEAYSAWEEIHKFICDEIADCQIGHLIE